MLHPSSDGKLSLPTTAAARLVDECSNGAGGIGSARAFEAGERPEGNRHAGFLAVGVSLHLSLRVYLSLVSV